MNQGQTYNNCEHHGMPQCKYKDDELMKNLVSYLEPQAGYTFTASGVEYGKMLEEVNNKMCSSCDSFKAIKSK